MGTTVFEDNIGIIDGSTSYGYLFKLEDLSTNFELNSVETSVTLNGVFYKNYIKNSDALFLANVKTFTWSGCNFTNNGYDTSGFLVTKAHNILLFTILEGYVYTLSSCEFTSNQVTTSPIQVTDQSALTASSPGAVNLLIQDTTFTSNQGSDNSGSFKIGQNKWLYL